MHITRKSPITLAAAVGIALTASASFAIGSSSALSQADLQAIYKALELKEHAGKLIDDCDEEVQPEIEAIDLNSDGRPEVFVTLSGACYGVAGAQLSLLIKNGKGQWQPNLGFPAGGYKVLTTTNLGYPDIEIGGPGSCFPVWRWDGAQYEIHKRCDR